MIFTDKTLRSRVLFVLGALVVFRLLSAIPIPGIDTLKLQNFINNNQFLGVLNVFSGGGLSHLSILMLGVGPYITSSIIMQLLTIMSPRLKAMYQEDGEIGRKKFTQLSRMITVPLAIVQGLSLIVVLQRQGVLGNVTLFGMFANVSVVVAGSMLLMWIGELISEFGIGNGVSLIIFAGIVANIPSEISQFLFTFDMASLPLYLLFLAVGLAIVAGVVVVTEAERPIPVTYAKQVRGTHVSGGTQTYLPLRLNQAGVIPIIFAISVLLFPGIVAQFFISAKSPWLAHAAQTVMNMFSTQGLGYGIAYFVLVVVFTYFYTSVVFNPKEIAENVQRNGGFLQGLRPGNQTAAYLQKVLNRITLPGATFLGLIAILPLALQQYTGSQILTFGGTGLLIVVSVVIETIKQIEAQLTMHDYEGY